MTPCKFCGKPIAWGEDERAKKVPLDPTLAVYAITQQATAYGDLKSVIRLTKDEGMAKHECGRKASCSNP